MLHPIIAAALMPLPGSVQDHLADLDIPEVNHALAASPWITPMLASRFAASGDITACIRALPKCDDVDLLTAFLKTNGLKAAYAARNPRLPSDELERSLKHSNDAVRLAGYCNPSTPLESRQQGLTKVTAHVLVNVAPTAAGDVIRGYELALANPWMLELSGEWSLPVHRGLTTLPEMTSDQYLAIRKAGYARWDSMKTHPAVTNDDPSRLSTRDLILVGACATDMLALTRDDLAPDDVPLFVSKVRREPEPHILARLMDRFGPTLLNSLSDRDRLSQTAYRAGAWSSPIVSYVGLFSHAWYSDVADAVSRLGENTTAWGLFTALAADASTGFAELADAAVSIAEN